MHPYLLDVHRLLRPPGTMRGVESMGPLRLRRLLVLILVCGFLYGAVMGSFGGIFGRRALQIIYSGTKVPLLLAATFFITLPSFFVLNTLLGLRNDFAQATRALVSTQAVLAIVLASLAPYTALWYCSSSVYPQATFFNGIMFAAASFTAQGVLRRLYRPLIQRDPRHKWMLRAWIVIYVFVAIQMAWMLRPFIGAPTLKTQFFRPEPFDNAYVIVAKLIWDVLFK